MEEEKKIAEEQPETSGQEKTPEREEAQEISGQEKTPENEAPEKEGRSKGKKKDGKKKKKFGPVKTSVCIVSAAAVAALGTWACIAFLRPQVRNDVDPAYGSVSIPVKDGEVFTAAAFTPELKARDENGNAISGDENTYDGLDVFGRINWMFAQQDQWYSEMHSTVDTAIGPQEVATYKRYSNGILISEDITTSSMINVAREYCYVNGERVIWRDSEQDKSKWNGMDTVFPDGAPLGNMNVNGDDGFRKLNGLPATELSVYVFEQNTIESATLSAAENVSLADGAECFTVTYRLKAKTDEEGKTGAAAYYGNQMVFTGGIDAPPDFDYIEISYTFTENWLPVRCTVSEKYTASMKTIVTTCTSTSTTEFSYDVSGIDEEVQEIYNQYYKQYADAEATGQTQRPLSATDCLASAFSPLLTEPTVLDVSLTLDGQPLNGSIWLDLGTSGGSLDLSSIKARADLGVLRLWMEGGKAYLNYGNVKLSLTTEELLALFTEGEPAAQAEGAGTSEDPLEAITGGEFTVEEKTARLHSVLHLGDAEIVLDFLFDHDGNRNVTLNKIGAEANFGGLPLDAEIKYGGTAPSELGESEKAAYTDATAYAGMLKDLFTADALRAEIGYTNTEYGITLGGGASVMYKDGFALKGDFTLGYGGAEKPVSVLFDGTTVYLDVDGVKVKAGTDELEALLSFLPAATEEETDVLSTVLEALLDSKFADLLSSAGTENTLSLTVKGTELLQYFGKEFNLGDVGIVLSGDGLTLSALGATVSLGGGDKFTTDVEAEEYASVLPYAPDLYDLFTGENLKVGVSYENTAANVSVRGELVLGMQDLAASATLNVTYGKVTKEAKLTYADGNVYLLVDGLRLKASTDEIADLIGADSPTDGPTDDSGTGSTDILGKLLALKFDTVITTLRSTGNALEAQVALDALLKGLGISTGKITLGDLTVTVENGNVTAEVLGVTLTLSASETAPESPESPESYTDLMPIASTVVGLVENNYIAADLNYNNGDIGLSGKVTLDLENMYVSAALTFTYQEATKQITALYMNDSVYLDVDGVKLKVNVQELKDVIGSMGGPAAAAEVLAPVEQLLENLGDILSISEENGALRATVAIDEILKAFGYNFTLGEATLTVDGEALNVSALEGALTLNVKKGSSFGTATDGYVEVSGSIKQLAGLFQNETIALGLTYTSERFGVNGTLTFQPATSAVHGIFTLTIDSVPRTLELDVLNGVVYLRIDGVKLKGDTAKVAALVKDILAETGTIKPDVTVPDMGTPDAGVTDFLDQLVDQLLNLKFGDYLELKAGDGGLKAVLKGTDLLRDLGVTLGLGDLTLTVSEEGISATGQGVELTVKAGKTLPAVDPSEYTDLGAVVDVASQIVAKKGVSFNGGFTLNVGKTQLAVYLEDAGISWKNGFELSARVVLEVNGVCNEFHVYATAEELTLSYGDIAAKIVYNDFSKIGDAFTALKNKVQAIADGVTGKTAQQDPAVASALSLAEGGEALAEFAEKFPALAQQLSGLLDSLSSLGSEFDWNALIGKIKLSPSTMAYGLFRLSLGDCTLDFVANGADGVSIHLNYAAKDGEIRVEGTAYAAALGEDGIQASAADIEYLGTDEFVLAVGYLGSAIDLLSQENITLTVSGSTTLKTAEPAPEPTPEPAPDVEAEPETGPEAAKGIKYDFNAALQYHCGSSVPVHLDVGGKNFWIDTDLFLNVHLALVAGDAAAETDKSLYLDLFILDGAPNKDGEGKLVTDGNLDFYVSVSQFGPDTAEMDSAGNSKYSPLRIYAPADEIMTILSSVVPMLGVKVDLLDNYLVSKWLKAENVAQLEALGGKIKPLLEGLLAGLLPAQPEEGAPAPAPASAAEERTYKNYIKSLTVKDEALSLVLNSADVYGAEGIDDLAVTLTRSEGKFDSVTFENVYDATGTENTTLTGTFDYTAVTPDIPADAASYTSFVGAEKLLLSLVKSATHAENAEVISGEETQHEYAVNENFYIDGSINVGLHLASLDLVKVEIKIIAVSITVDDSGIGLNLRLEYDGNYNGVVAIFGSAFGLDGHIINGDTTLDLTLKNGMIYMKRVQTTDSRRSPLPAPITLYRAMPAENFLSDIFGQLSFMLNFGEKLWGFIQNQINSSGSTEPTPEETVDYGKKLSEVLKSYVYTAEKKSEDGSIITPASWNLTLNGDALAKSVLGDLNVVISEDQDGYIHDIKMKAAVIPILNGSLIDADLNLRWRNPGGIMEEGASDLTHDVSGTIEDHANGMGAMIEKLNTDGGWTQTQDDGTVTYKFLEAKERTVSFKYHTHDGGEADLGKPQTVLVSSGGDGNTENTLYSELIYPDLPANNAEFTYAWESEQVGFEDILSADVIFAKQTKCTYTVTLISDSNLGDGWENSGDTWTRTAEMEYGAKIVAGNQVYTVTDTAREFRISLEDIPEMSGRTGHWKQNPDITEKGMTLTAEYDGDTVHYTSVVPFTADGMEGSNTEHSVTFGSSYTLVPPTADGYTFLGWYKKTGDTWEKVETLELNENGKTTVEVEALWAKPNYGFTMSGSRSGKIGNYTYNVSIVETEEQLVGAFAEDVTRSVKYEFYIGTGNPGEYTVVDGRSYSASGVNSGLSTVRAYAKVTVTYTDASGNVLLEIVVEHNGTYNGWNGDFTQKA